MAPTLGLCGGLAAALRSATAVSFNLPFDASQYTGGSLETASDDGLTEAIVYWRTDAESIHIALAATAWWVGFGMNPHGPSMAGADIVVCREHEVGIISAGDYSSNRYGAPDLDDMQDWHTVRAGRELPSFPAGPPGACEQGWTWGGNACFRVSETSARWDQARQSCVDMGGEIAKVATEAQNVLVRSLASEGESLLWVGARRSGGELKWQDGTTLSYDNFYSTEPNGDGDCVAMGYMSNLDSNWMDVNCMWSKPRFACMKPVIGSTPTVPPAAQQPNPLVTWCEASRARYTCEKTQDIQLADLSVGIHGLLAWSPSWAMDDSSLAYHGHDHRRSLPLLLAGNVETPPSEDAVTFTLQAPTHTVTTEGGSYACSYHVLPVDPVQRYHIIWYKLQQSGPAKVAGLQHHVDLNACDNAVEGLSDGDMADCGFLMGTCWRTLLNQAGMYSPGGMATPPDAGILIGKDALQYVVISRHFYNPARKEGVVDVGTQFHIRYTPTLRANDMSQITLGTSQFMVPPKTFDHPVMAWCSSSCTQRLGEVRVISVAFHMHGYGASTRVRVVRDGQELEPLASLKPWDQALATMSTNRVLLPGDSLILECVFNNDLETDLHYGDAIGDEMCYGFLMLVGQNSMARCLDFPWGGFHCKAPNTEDCLDGNAKSYCPDESHTGQYSIVDNQVERLSTFAPFVPPSRAECEQTANFVVVPAIPGGCRSPTWTVSGSRTCDVGDWIDFRVEWTTDCGTNTVKFDLSASIGTTGWLGMGLHDAGTASSPISMGTAMNGADIIQASANAGSIREGVGVGYTVPQAKATPSASLTSASVVNGRSTVSFTRPFEAAEGLQLAQDRFVWLICAYRKGPVDFEAKHNNAASVSAMRVSLFGGVGESKRSAVAAEPVSGQPAGCTGAPSGQQTCGMGVGFRVDWVMNCEAQTVDFTMSAELEKGWLAVGFHDAGTPEAQLTLEAPMLGADIVQASHAGGTFLDGVGVGYTAPKAKDTGAATLLSSERSGGRTSISFRRTFASAEGLALQSDRLVWLVCAYNGESNDLSVIHQAASAALPAVSLFSPPLPTPVPAPAPAPAPTPTASPEHTCALEVSFDVCKADLSSCQSTCQDVIGQSIGVDPDQVLITDLSEGSLIIKFTLAPDVPPEVLRMDTASIVDAVDAKIGNYTPSEGVERTETFVALIDALKASPFRLVVTTTQKPASPDEELLASAVRFAVPLLALTYALVALQILPVAAR